MIERLALITGLEANTNLRCDPDMAGCTWLFMTLLCDMIVIMMCAWKQRGDVCRKEKVRYEEAREATYMLHFHRAAASHEAIVTGTCHDTTLKPALESLAGTWP